MSGLLLDNKSDLIWRKVYVVQLGEIFWRDPENSWENSFKMAKLKGEFWTQNLPRTQQECYLDLDVLLEFLIS